MTLLLLSIFFPQAELILALPSRRQQTLTYLRPDHLFTHNETPSRIGRIVVKTSFDSYISLLSS